ncbi:GyrI-like domain-containing protein [Cellulomonas sp. URHE0023]|uniref:GyrI-like domain-containing protein n=1 Tax=Cellulomonas sp. URHE0023 TaxID=1380354 RepID=UPI0004886060|nr:GyrI-like domain-containing protein [Cellulomonas sp. URHE0023]
MDITLEEQPTVLVAVLRERVAMDALVAFYDRAYRAALQEVAAAGLTITGPAFGWYRDMPTDSVDLAAGFWVGAQAVGALAGGVEVVELPGGPAAVGVHRGGYDTLPAAWAEFRTWTMQQDATMRGDFLEVYVTDPSAVAEADQNETRLVLPLVS